MRNFGEAVDDYGLWQHGYFHEEADKNGTNQRMVGTPIRMSGTPLIPSGHAPELGQDTDEIMVELGYTEQEIHALRQQDVI